MSHFKIIFIWYNDLMTGPSHQKFVFLQRKGFHDFLAEGRRAKMFTGVLIQATDEVNERNEVNEIL